MQCEAIIQQIQERREYLLETIEMDKEHKLRILKVCVCLCVFEFEASQFDFNDYNSLRNTLFKWKFSFSQEQQINCTGKLQQTTGLIQFCIEALKEIDNAAFLQVWIWKYIRYKYERKNTCL